MASAPSQRHREVVLLGRGGMGEVYLAVNFGIGGFRKLLVLKRLRPEFAENQEFLKMFLDEARLAARLEHPNVVRTTEVGVDDWSYFIAMEYLDGQSLHSVLREGRKRDAAPASDREVRGGLTFVQRVFLRAIADSCAGLHYAHEKMDHAGQPLNIVHRDVSPGNVFVTYEGVVKVLDFGIAKATDSNTHTQVGVLKGKVPYMAPESLVSKGGKPDRRADVYAIGAMLWDCAVGERLWKGLPDLEIMSRVARGQIPSPRTAAPDVPAELERIVMRALSPDLAKRYQTALEVQTEVEELLHRTAPVSTRVLGKYVSALFETRRAEAKTIIEQRLRALQSEVSSGHGPSGALSLPGVSSARSLPEGRPSVTGPALPEPVQATSVGGQPTMLSAPAPDAQATSVPHVRVAEPPPPYGAPPSPQGADEFPAARPSRRVLVGALFGAVALGAAGIVALTGGKDPETSEDAGDAGAIAVVPPGSVASPPPGSGTLKIEASPPEAVIRLDGSRLAGNPAEVRLAADPSRAHRIEVTAPGYDTATQNVTFDGTEQNLAFVLKRRRR